MATAGDRGRGLAQLAVQQQLRAAYGIKMKSRGAKGKLPSSAATGAEGGKVFGIALLELPHQVVPEYGSIPCFLVEACEYLEEHIHTEGLFRKSGSFVRIKALKNKLDRGEHCLSTAQPCDVAGLLKQFFRELPEPLLPSDLQEALVKAQQLNSEEEKNSATLLLSCLVHDRAVDILRYFFSFLKKVSLRSTENKMDSSNLAVIFAPNLLQSSAADKMSAHTDRKLRLQAAVVQTLIDHAEEIGRIPKFILEKIPAMLGIDDSVSTPSLQDYEESEGETPGEHKRRRRRSIGGNHISDVVSGALNKLKSNRTPCTTPQRDGSVFSSVTPMIVTPSIKRKCPADSCQGFSSKKRRSLRHNLALELLPSSLFSISSTPASAQFEVSPLEASQSSLSTSVTSDKHLPRIGSRRSKRIASKKVHRVESGKTGCFSPKISRKEIVRRSLRLKFSLGKSSKENTTVEHAVNRSENIGRRLANQQDTESGADFLKAVALLSPCAGDCKTNKGSKSISKSEENLLIPNHHDEASYQMSWTGPSTTRPQESSNSSTTLKAGLEEETCSSDLALTARKCSALTVLRWPSEASMEQDSNKQQTSFCEEENNMTTVTLLKIKKAFSESGSNLHNLRETEPSKLTLTQETGCISESGERECLKVQEMVKVEKESQFASSANECSAPDKPQTSMDGIHTAKGPFFKNTTLPDHSVHKLSKSGISVQDQLTELVSPGDHLNKIHTLKKEILESNWQFAPEGTVEDITLKSYNSEKKTEQLLEKKGELLLSQLPEDKEGNSKQHICMETSDKSKPSPSGKVADHIHWFNKLSLNEPCSATKTKLPLKFQRTPVRQSVRRMNSLLEANRQAITCKLMKPGDGYPLVKSVSFETALSSCTERISSTSTTSLPSETMNKQICTCDQLALSSKSYPQVIHPTEQAKKLDKTCKEKLITNNPSKSVLEDLTNHEAPKAVVKVNTNMNVSVVTPDKCVFRKTVAEKKLRYRGSPKNPMSTTQLLPVIKPLDL